MCSDREPPCKALSVGRKKSIFKNLKKNKKNFANVFGEDSADGAGEATLCDASVENLCKGVPVCSLRNSCGGHNQQNEERRFHPCRLFFSSFVKSWEERKGPQHSVIIANLDSARVETLLLLLREARKVAASKRRKRKDFHETCRQSPLRASGSARQVLQERRKWRRLQIAVEPNVPSSCVAFFLSFFSLASCCHNGTEPNQPQFGTSDVLFERRQVAKLVLARSFWTELDFADGFGQPSKSIGCPPDESTPFSSLGRLKHERNDF